MEKTGSIIGIRKLLFLICMVAIVFVANESVCFGLADEGAVVWPLPSVWWNGVATPIEPNYWMDPCNWNLDGNVPTADMNVGYSFITPPDGVQRPDTPDPPTNPYMGEPNIVIIRTGEVAECNYLRWGSQQSYANLVIQGTLKMGKGPGTVYGLRICSWTGWQRNKVVIDGGTLDVNGDTDQSYMLVPSGDVNVLGQIGMGWGTASNQVWSDQYFMTITNGTVRAGDFMMYKFLGKVVAGPSLDINGTGQLIVKGDRRTRFNNYLNNGYIKAYGGDPNYVVAVALDANGDTRVAAAPYIAAKAHLVSPRGDTPVDWEDPNSRGNGPALTWTAGTGATGKHRVYFGTAFTDVNDANTSSSTYKGEQVLADVNYSVPLTSVDLNGTYYWRVDENDAGVIVKGDVWQFAIRPNRVIDEFETYTVDTLGAVWEASGYSSVTIEEAADDGITHVNDGVQAMSFSYDNRFSPFISEATMSPLALKGCPNDWTAANVKLLTLSLHGNKTFAEKKVYVYLESNGGTQSGIVYYPDANHLLDQGNWDANALLAQGNWEYYRFWAINLAKFSAQGVNLTNITKLVIGVGNKASPTAGGYGTILVDSIRLEPAMCLGQDNDADLNNDCTVDMSDLVLLTDSWLATSQTVVASAPTVGPVLWYKFDETSGSSAADSSGKGNNGTVNVSGGPYSYWSAGGYDGGNCLNLGTGPDSPISTYTHAYVAIPTAAFDANWGAECTISLWLKDTGQDDNDDMLFQFNSGDGTDRGPQVWSGATGFMAWTCGYDPVTLYKDYLWYGQDIYYSNPSHPLNKWVHYAFVKSYSGKYIRVYQDGVIVAENAGRSVTGSKLDDATASSLFTIGAWGYMSSGTSTYGGYYTGKIDDFRIYNYALSPAQVLSLALNGGAGSITQPLVTRANAMPDGIVNLKDFAVMANKWLQEVVYP
ncbi:MAG: LamG domain-containing protein [Sedimentisphaerales bacterium]|jgi:hypothetical protein